MKGGVMKLMRIIGVGLWLITAFLWGQNVGIGSISKSYKNLDTNQVVYFDLTTKQPLDDILNIKRETRHYMIRRLSQEDTIEMQKISKWVLMPESLYMAFSEALDKK